MPESDATQLALVRLRKKLGSFCATKRSVSLIASMKEDGDWVVDLLHGAYRQLSRALRSMQTRNLSSRDWAVMLLDLLGSSRPAIVG